MKYFSFAVLMTGTAFAQTITGIPVLKGSLKTKILVRSIQTTCRVKVIKIRNLMEEDAFGNPGYRLRVEANLEGKNDKQETVVKFDKEFALTNFWAVNGQTVAKDLDYTSTDGAYLRIKPDGRLQTFSFQYGGEKITCSF